MHTTRVEDCQPVFQWTPDYAIGEPIVDDEHKRLFALVEKLHQAMLAGKGKEKLERLLAELVDYTCYHFAHEEELMYRTCYPAFRNHCIEHENLRSRLHAIQERVLRGEVTITIEAMLFLAEWLKRHTTTSDMKIARFLDRQAQ